MFQEIEKTIFDCNLKLTTYLGTHLAKIQDGCAFQISMEYPTFEEEREGSFIEEASELPSINNFVVVAIDKDFNIKMVDIEDDEYCENVVHVSDISLNALLEICQYIENNF